MNELEKRVVGTLEGLDEMGNAILGSVDGIPAAGNPHYTMSQRWAYERQAGVKVVGKFGYKKACVICKMLTYMFKPFFWNQSDYDHCADAIKDFPPNLTAEG